MSILNIVLGVLVGLFSLVFLIVSHEFGHFLMARKNGVRVKEFGVGFPPRAKAWTVKRPKKKTGNRFKDFFGVWKKLPKKNWEKEQSDLIVSLNYLPLGGFCAMDGEADDDDREGTFGASSYLSKTKILFGGVLMNWLIAFVIFTVLCWTGLPAVLDGQFTIEGDEKVVVKEPVTVASIVEGSPAEKSNFSVGDGILGVRTEDGSEQAKVLSATDVIEFNQKHAGETVIYTVSHPIEILSQKRCGGTKDGGADSSYPCEGALPKEKTVYRGAELAVTLNKEATEESPLLGVSMAPSSTRSHYTWAAPIVGAGLTVQVTAETYKGLGQMLVNLVTGAARQISADEAVRAEGREQVSEATEGVSGIVGILGSYFPNIISAGPAYTFLLIAIISVSLACMNVLPIPALDGGRWLMITLARLKRKRLSKETEQKMVARAFIFLLALMAIITVVDIVRLLK